MALRIFMLLAAWQGPMPWCHRHGTLADSTATSANRLAPAPTWLAKHLQTYHGSVSPFSDLFFGWHMHAVFPGSSTDDPNQPRKSEQFRLPAPGGADSLIEQLVAAGEHWPVSSTEQTEALLRGLAKAGGSDSGTAVHFFDGFAPSLPLPLRFCIARC